MLSVPFCIDPNGRTVAQINFTGKWNHNVGPYVTFSTTSDSKKSIVLQLTTELIEAIRLIGKTSFPISVGVDKGVKIVSTNHDVYLELPGRVSPQVFFIRNPMVEGYLGKEDLMETLAKNLEQALNVERPEQIADLVFIRSWDENRCFNIVTPGCSNSLRFGIGRHNVTAPRNAVAQYELMSNNDVYMMTLYHPTADHADDAAAEFKARIEGFEDLLDGKEVAWLSEETPLKFMATKTRRVHLVQSHRENVDKHEYKVLSIYDQQFCVAFQILYTDDILKDMTQRMKKMYDTWVKFRDEINLDTSEGFQESSNEKINVK